MAFHTDRGEESEYKSCGCSDFRFAGDEEDRIWPLMCTICSVPIANRILGVPLQADSATNETRPAAANE